MKPLLFYTLLLAICVTPAAGQARGAADSLRAQARRMANGLVTGDYTTFIEYLHPKIIQISGGPDGLKQQMEGMSRQMKAVGASWLSITLDSVSKIIKEGPTLQATIRQHTSMKMPTGHIVGTSTLIGISLDNGLHWKFVDTINKNMKDMQQLLPNLSTALEIPPQRSPVHYNQ